MTNHVLKSAQLDAPNKQKLCSYLFYCFFFKKKTAQLDAQQTFAHSFAPKFEQRISSQPDPKKL